MLMGASFVSFQSEKSRNPFLFGDFNIYVLCIMAQCSRCNTAITVDNAVKTIVEYLYFISLCLLCVLIFCPIVLHTAYTGYLL